MYKLELCETFSLLSLIYSKVNYRYPLCVRGGDLFTVAGTRQKDSAVVMMMVVVFHAITPPPAAAALHFLLLLRGQI